MDYHDLDPDINEDSNDEHIELSDVIEVIETDPDFQEHRIHPANMLNGGTMEISPTLQASPNQASPLSTKKQARVTIVEQPASKALRFRYECEGRSAGSIPGARSTPENKTYPTIRVEGYQSRAVVVVSCVTRDEPYKPHPHNLVGREGCKRGVCTLEIPTDTMTVQFSNLGIQCIKKKDIEHALRIREEIRVDPFRTGFSHRNQPTAIDLNVVRLCFQVFLEGATPGRFSVALPPVVSEPIYDKKAMSDLTIIKLSDCVSYVDGGRKDIILLCEKVAKEDIQVRFFEDSSDWEAFADIQPSQVHKQHAIWFRTPRYKTIDVTEPVKVFIQLRRPTDGATSDPLPFEFWPPGTPPYWSYRRTAKKGNYSLFDSILARSSKRRASNIDQNANDLSEPDPPVTVQNDVEPKETNNNSVKSTYNELIDQVAELDEIYLDTQTRLLDQPLPVTEQPAGIILDSFDDAKTYSSLQLAFKNPLDITVTPTVPPKPLNKRENDNEKLPPLPPKRTKKIETFIGNNPQLQRPKSTAELARQTPTRALPPAPNFSTLPNPKKRGFFSKLFGRGKAKSARASREPSLSPSTRTAQSLQVLSKSCGDVSTHSAGSVRIPLKDDSPDAEDAGMDLTEAEHYALYTAVAPHATQSEFDEMSCYYAPVEGGRVGNAGDGAARLGAKT